MCVGQGSTENEDEEDQLKPAQSVSTCEAPPAANTCPFPCLVYSWLSLARSLGPHWPTRPLTSTATRAPTVRIIIIRSWWLVKLVTSWPWLGATDHLLLIHLCPAHFHRQQLSGLIAVSGRTTVESQACSPFRRNGLNYWEDHVEESVAFE